MTSYISTRGEAPRLGFCDVMLTGLARDGGLYVPEVWPQLSSETIAGFFGRPYWEVAVEVIRPFVAGEISEADLGRMAIDIERRHGQRFKLPLRCMRYQVIETAHDVVQSRRRTPMVLGREIDD